MTNNDSMDYGEILRRIFSELNDSKLDSYLQKFEGFYSEYKSILSLQDDWKKYNAIIGVVGITSTGKSALINALFGEKLLPEGYVPTSNTKVVCRQCRLEEQRRLRIYYNTDEKIDTFEGDALTYEIVKQYLDERENVNNKLGIKEAIIESPKFLVPSYFELVDTPGLGAWGREHDKLTLKIILPCLDFVLYTV